MKSKLILTDCDGVLLDWGYRFKEFMEEGGYVLSEDSESKYHIHDRYTNVKDSNHGKQLVVEFNESARIGFLPSFRDSIKYVKKLHIEHGYIFGVITSLTTDHWASILRKQNLINLFGENVFDFVKCIDTGADKDFELMEYANTECWWIEDNVTNYLAGKRFGLNSILMDHPYNRNIKESQRACNWKQIYSIIIGDL